MESVFRTEVQDIWSLQSLMEELLGISEVEIKKTEQSLQPLEEGDKLICEVPVDARRILALANRYFNEGATLRDEAMAQMDQLNETILSPEENKQERQKLHHIWHRGGAMTDKSGLLHYFFSIILRDVAGLNCSNQSRRKCFGAECMSYPAIKQGWVFVELSDEELNMRRKLFGENYGQSDSGLFPLENAFDLLRSVGIIPEDDTF